MDALFPVFDKSNRVVDVDVVYPAGESAAGDTLDIAGDTLDIAAAR